MTEKQCQCGKERCNYSDCEIKARFHTKLLCHGDCQPEEKMVARKLTPEEKEKLTCKECGELMRFDHGCQPDTPAEKDTKSEVSKHSSEDVNKPTESWEERFDERFRIDTRPVKVDGAIGEAFTDKEGGLTYPDPLKIKAFIRTEIARQEKETRQKTLEEAEGAVNDHECDGDEKRWCPCGKIINAIRKLRDV